MTTKYEVQFKTGDGSWRRWSLTSTPEKAEASLKRLNVHLGDYLVALGFSRVKTVTKPAQRV